VGKRLVEWLWANAGKAGIRGDEFSGYSSSMCQRPMTSTRTAALTTTLGAVAACWLIAAQQMRGMDMSTETTLGSFPFFIASGPR